MISLMFRSSSRVSGDMNDERYWNSTGYVKTQAGVNVDEESALVHAAVFRCSRLLSEPPSGLPIRCYKMVDDDRVAVGTDEVPAIEHLTVAPNPSGTAGVFRASHFLHQINWGNGFAEIVRDRFGRVVQLWPIHPSRVTPAKPDSGFTYAVKNPDRSVTGLRRDEMLHTCGTLSDDGVWGRGVIKHARENIGSAIGTERHGAKFFGSGAQPKGVVIAPGLVKSEDRNQFRREWKEMHGSPESSEVAILPKDSSYLPITISNQDSQFLETQVRNQEVVCNWYGVPLYMLGARVLGGSIESLSSEFIIYSLYPWVRRFEEQANFKLLDRNQWGLYSFEHDFSGLLRGDIQSRMNAYRVAITTGVYTINHCRRLENLPGIGEAGDVVYVPANMVSAEYMAEHGSGASTRGPGSDHTGAPADNPLDHEPKARMFHEFLNAQNKIKADDLAGHVRDMESRLEDRPVEWREAAKVSLTDVLRRMFTKEGQAVLQHIEKKEYAVWAREFFAKHEQVLTGALEPACMALRLAGVKKWEKPAELAAWLRARSVDALERTRNNDSKEVRLRKLAAWPTDRVAEMVEEILA